MLGNINGKKTFTIPVSWEVYDHIEVQANSLGEAINWANEHSDEIPLGTDPEYVDGSYQIGEYELAKAMNSIEQEERDDL